MRPRDTRIDLGHSWPRYVWASRDRLAAGHTMTNDTARADGPWGRRYGERCAFGACPTSAASRSRVLKRPTGQGGMV